MSDRGSDILAFTVTYGTRNSLPTAVPTMRATAGCWFDWLWCLGAPSDVLSLTGQEYLRRPDQRGIQYLIEWPENRGQHHATRAALELARERGYKWLLRLDDDITPRRRKWLKLMLERLEDLKTRKEDHFYRLIAAPRIVGLQNPLQPVGVMDVGQPYTVEVMQILGGACRLHPVELLEDFEPDLYQPLGRGDPERLSEYMFNRVGGFLVRFPDIKMRHDTVKLERLDSPEQALQRKMGKSWCYLGPGV